MSKENYSKKVFLAAFLKARKETNTTKKTHLARHISDVLLEEFKFSVSERSLRDYYNHYQNEINDQRKQGKPEVIKYLCKYLGYEDFKDFILQQEEIDVTEGGNKERRIPWMYLTIGGVSIICIVALFYFNNEEKKCMVWSEDQYHPIACDSLNPSHVTMDPLRLEKFKKETLDTTKTFFEEGKPLYWYYKSSGKIEFFTDAGKHPVTGETLKPITETIIKKYVYKTP